MRTPVSHFKWLLNISESRYAGSLTRLASDSLSPQQLFEVEDLCDSNRPDERSVMTYVASYFHAFSTMGMLHHI